MPVGPIDGGEMSAEVRLLYAERSAGFGTIFEFVVSVIERTRCERHRGNLPASSMYVRTSVAAETPRLMGAKWSPIIIKIRATSVGTDSDCSEVKPVVECFE